MVRAPCCEKMGLKKGPWTPEEDQILINYIQLYGHGNWRALPKLAGLLRCGKSCRLRWTNYLRPDIKRGNFSREEEDYIINLHEMLGNRWSAIAGRLPGRTDNEIKNVWHTRLKKRIKQSQNQTTAAAASAAEPGRQILMIDVSKEEEGPVKNHVRSESGSSEYRPVSDPVLEECSSEDMSSSATTAETCVKMEPSESEEGFVEIIDENFWSEMLSADNPGEAMSDLSSAGGGGDSWQLQFPDTCAVLANASNSNGYENMEFWHDLSTRSAGGGGDSWRLQFPDTCAVLANASNSNGFENMEFWHDFLLDRPGNYLNCQSFDRI